MVAIKLFEGKWNTLKPQDVIANAQLGMKHKGRHAVVQIIAVAGDEADDEVVIVVRSGGNPGETFHMTKSELLGYRGVQVLQKRI